MLTEIRPAGVADGGSRIKRSAIEYSRTKVNHDEAIGDGCDLLRIAAQYK
jgi:hypothetical protein